MKGYYIMDHIEISFKKQKLYERALEALKMSNIDHYPIDEQNIYICGHLKKKQVQKVMDDYLIKCDVKKHEDHITRE